MHMHVPDPAASSNPQGAATTDDEDEDDDDDVAALPEVYPTTIPRSLPAPDPVRGGFGLGYRCCGVSDVVGMWYGNRTVDCCSTIESTQFNTYLHTFFFVIQKQMYQFKDTRDEEIDPATQRFDYVFTTAGKVSEIWRDLGGLKCDGFHVRVKESSHHRARHKDHTLNHHAITNTSGGAGTG